MKRTNPVRTLLCAAALAFGVACAHAQDAAAPDPTAEKAERLRRARARWEKMSPEERDGILRRFEKWSKLPPDQREDLRRRFDEIGGREGAGVVRRRMEELRRASPEQIQHMRLQAAVLGRLWERFTGSLPPKVAERWAALPPEAKERMRRRFSRGIVAVCMEAVVRRYGTEPERAAFAGADPEARRAVLAAVKARIRDTVLLPRKEELEKLDPAERKAREARLLEEHIWTCAREGLPNEGMWERLPQIRAAMEKALAEPSSGRNPRRGPEQKNGHDQKNGPDQRNGPEKNGKDWFEKEFGVSRDDLGERWAGRPLMLALRMQKPEARPAFLASVRPELLRIAGLPAAEREGALKALLEKIR